MEAVYSLKLKTLFMTKKHPFYAILFVMLPWLVVAIGAAEMKSEYKDDYKHDNNNDHSKTILWEACKQGHLDLVKYLIEREIRMSINRIRTAGHLYTRLVIADTPRRSQIPCPKWR